MFISQGDIVLVPYPLTDLVNSKKRPAIVISNALINKSKDVVLAQITSTIVNDEFTFRLDDTLVTKPLRTYCEIRCDNLFTAEKDLILQKISSLKPNVYSGVLNLIYSGIKILSTN